MLSWGRIDFLCLGRAVSAAGEKLTVLEMPKTAFLGPLATKSALLATYSRLFGRKSRVLFSKSQLLLENGSFLTLYLLSRFIFAKSAKSFFQTCQNYLKRGVYTLKSGLAESMF